MIPADAPWPDVYRDVDARGWWPVVGVDLACSSWPYFALAKYSDEADEWGAGTLDRYLADGVRYALSAWEAVRPGGWMVVNLGDTRSGSGGAGGQVSKAGQRKYRQDGSHGVVGAQWLLVPERAALAVQAETGWQLAGKVIWRKPTPNRADHGHLARNRRPGLQHEMVFMFWKPGGSKTFNAQVLVDADAQGDVWDLPKRTSRPDWAQRSDDVKAWSDELCDRLVRLLSNPGDLVADPCAGYGSMGRVAEHLGRRGYMSDLYWGRADLPGAAEAVRQSTARRVAAVQAEVLAARNAALFAAAG